MCLNKGLNYIPREHRIFMPSDDEREITKFSAMSEKGKELLEKGIDATKASSKKAYDAGKKITEEGISQAKDGMTALSKKKDDYIAQRNARKLEESTVEMESKGTSKKKSNSKNKHVSDEELEKMVFASENEYVDQPTQLDLIQEQMKQIEHDFPTVLLEQTQPVVKRKDPINWARMFASVVLFAYGLLTLIHTLAPYSDSSFVKSIAVVIQYLIPSFLSNTQWPLILGAATTLVLITSSILTISENRFVSTLLLIHYAGVLCLGRVIFIFYDETQFDSAFAMDFLVDIVRTALIVGISQSHRAIPEASERTPTIFDYTGILTPMGKKPNTSDDLGSFIEEGLSMDFRTEVAKPKPPRARAKFEAYEIVILIVAGPLWVYTFVMTNVMGTTFTVAGLEFTSGPIQVALAWSMSLLSLIALVRFDRAARGNGWYAKEKETYVGMMDLYSKAQAKHYEYVELRAAAEAQEILEKYPQLDKAKSTRSSNA